MISRASSRRRTGSPKSLVVNPVPPSRPKWPLWPPSGVLHRGGGVVHGLLDVGVARAPAEVAADHVGDLLVGELRGVVPLLQAGRDRREEARCAEAALQCVALAEGLLYRVQHLPAPVVVAGQALDGRDGV